MMKLLNFSQWSVATLTLMFCLVLEVQARPNVVATNNVGQFDGLLLSLSWSPEFCADSINRKKNEEQCGRHNAGRGRYGWVLHGLWPQSVQVENKSPQFCSQTWLSSSLINQYEYLFPSKALMIHQWKKHGSCYSERPEEYFSTVSELMQRVKLWMPPELNELKSAKVSKVNELKAMWIQAAKKNGVDISPNALLVLCSRDGRFLREVRWCFNRNLSLQTCQVEAQRRAENTCRGGSFLIRPL